MDALFAPWRMDWVNRDRSDEDDAPDCVFCALPDRDSDEDSLIVARSNHAFVLLNNMPYNPGHAMVVPFTHGGEFSEISTAKLHECMLLSQEVVGAAEDTLAPDGFNIGFNVGSAGGASINDHLHMHIIPRWHSDTSFMPLTANTAIVEEAITETYDRLRDALQESEAATKSTGQSSVVFDLSSR